MLCSKHNKKQINNCNNRDRKPDSIVNSVTTLWRIPNHGLNITFFVHEGHQVLKPSVNANRPALSLSHITQEVLMTLNETWETRRHPSAPSHSAPPASWSTWKCPSCPLPLNRLSTKTKHWKKKKNKNMYTSGRRPLQRGVCIVLLGLPCQPTGCSAFWEDCRWKTQADGKEGPAPEKRTHTNTLTHTHTHTFSLYIQPQWTAAPWYHLASPLLHSGHCHRQTVQKGTYSWGRRQGRELALQYSVQSAGRCHSLLS